MSFSFFARNALHWLPWILARRGAASETTRNGKEDDIMSDFYDAFLSESRLGSEDDFCETRTFEWGGVPVIVKLTKAKAKKTDEFFCEPNKLTWRRSLPAITSFPHTFLADSIPEDSVIQNHAFARRGAICIFVVRGAPSNFRWIDEHEWIRADNPDDARGRIYLMSEERFRTFVPGENAVH